jgi:hypothetical protein
MYCNTIDFVQVNAVLLSPTQPRNAPLLVVNTVWCTKDGGPIHIPTLIDTGCSTSIIHHSLTQTLRSVNGEELNINQLEGGTKALTAASGDNMIAEHACNATFIFEGTTIAHTMFVLNNLACRQKLLLGMDFLNEHKLTISIEHGTITFPDMMVNTIMPIDDLVLLFPPQMKIASHRTIKLPLKTNDESAIEDGIIGYVYAHPRLQDGLIIWEGVQLVDDGSVLAYITNTTDEEIEVCAKMPLAIWESNDEQDFVWTDMLDDEITNVVSVLKMDASKLKPADQRQQNEEDLKEENTQRIQASASSASNASTPQSDRVVIVIDDDEEKENKDGDWQWEEEHLHIDVSRVPKQRPDPGVEATVESLMQAWEETWNELAGNREWTHDDCAEINGKLQQLVRLNDRMRTIALSTEEVKELPPEINLVKGYNHLTSSQRNQLKEALQHEASFFMKGKYPKVIRTGNPVSINIGTLPPR